MSVNDKRVPRLTHTLLCDVLGVERSRRAPWRTRYAKQVTKLQISVDGDRIVMGGHYSCACCEYGIDLLPDGHGPETGRCPRCGYDGVDCGTLPTLP